MLENYKLRKNFNAQHLQLFWVPSFTMETSTLLQATNPLHFYLINFFSRKYRVALQNTTRTEENQQWKLPKNRSIKTELIILRIAQRQVRIRLAFKQGSGSARYQQKCGPIYHGSCPRNEVGVRLLALPNML